MRKQEESNIDANPIYIIWLVVCKSSHTIALTNKTLFFFQISFYHLKYKYMYSFEKVIIALKYMRLKSFLASITEIIHFFCWKLKNLFISDWFTKKFFKKSRFIPLILSLGLNSGLTFIKTIMNFAYYACISIVIVNSLKNKLRIIFIFQM